MKRHIWLTSVAAVFGLSAFFVHASPGIRSAQGCSGAGPKPATPVCTKLGWSGAEWAVDPSDVPTDGVLFVRFVQQEVCEQPGGAGGAGGGASVPAKPAPTVTLRGADGALVDTLAPASFAPMIQWRPTSMMPSTSYTVRVEGLIDGSSKELTFKTGPGPMQPPAATLMAPALTTQQVTTGPDVCCTRSSTTSSPYPWGSCGQPSNQQTTLCERPVIEAHLVFGGYVLPDVAPPSVAPFVTTRMEVLVDGVALPYASQAIPPGAAEVCARAVATNTLTHVTTTSKPWCMSTASFDLSPKSNCDRVAALIAGCSTGSGGAGGAPTLSKDAAKQFAASCPGRTDGVAQGGAASAPSGTNGEIGCATTPGRPPRGALFAALCVVAAAVARRRRSAKSDDAATRA